MSTQPRNMTCLGRKTPVCEATFDIRTVSTVCDSPPRSSLLSSACLARLVTPTGKRLPHVAFPATPQFQTRARRSANHPSFDAVHHQQRFRAFHGKVGLIRPRPATLQPQVFCLDELPADGSCEHRLATFHPPPARCRFAPDGDASVSTPRHPDPNRAGLL